MAISVSYLVVLGLFLAVSERGQTQDSVQAVRGAMGTLAQRFAMQYHSITAGIDPLSCRPEDVLSSCIVDSDSQQFGIVRDASFVLQNPARLTSLCAASQQLQAYWEELQTNFTDAVKTLYYTDALGSYLRGHTTEDTKSLCPATTESYDARKQAGYIQTLSSPKATIILNLLTQPSSNALDTINTILSSTLTPVDYFGLYSSGIDTVSEFRTSVVEATETNITQIQTRLQEVNQSGVLLSDNIFSWFDDTARANFIAVVGTLDSVDVCFQTLIVLVDSDITAIVETAISGAIARNSELTAFVYSFNDASDYANMQDLVCSTGAVLYNQVGQRLGFGLSDYLNYFVTDAPLFEAFVSPQSTGIFNTAIDASVCAPVVDAPTIPTLLGVLCVEVKSTDFSGVEFSRTTATCPILPVSNPFRFSLLASSYSPPSDPIPFYCSQAAAPEDLVGQLPLLMESFSRRIGLASEIVSSDFVMSTCPAITGISLTSNCLSNGDLFQSDPNFDLPTSLAGSSLLWPARLQSQLPLVTTDFNTLDSTLPLWQDVCTTAYLDQPWQSIFSSLPPLTTVYGDYFNGYTRHFPAFRATTDTCGSLDTSDARLESWFAATASGPKAIVILIDLELNTPEDFQRIVTAAHSLLNILNQYDYFNVISSDQSGSLFSNLVPATVANIAIAHDFFDKYFFDVTTRGPSVAVISVQQLYQNALNSIPVPPNYALIVLSDNSLIDVGGSAPVNYLESVIDFLTQNQIRVFSYLFNSFVDGNSLKSVACTTGGLYNRITDEQSDYERALAVAGFYRFYAAVRSALYPIWHEYFIDEVTGGNSTRLCVTIYPDIFPVDTFNSLLGVSCVHIPVNRFTTAQLTEIQNAVYNIPPSATPLVLTAEQEDFLRGDERCDTFTTPPPPTEPTANDFRIDIENTVHAIRSFSGEAFLSIVAPSKPLVECPYGDGVFYTNCDSTFAPSVVQDTDTYGCGVNTSESSIRFSSLLAPIVLELGYQLQDPYYPVESPLFHQLCLSEALSGLWSSADYIEKPGALWYYYADSLSSTLTFHPYADCGRNDDSFCGSRSYQPKFTPWYASTVSGSKNVYILIHTSDQTNSQAMLDGAIAVIATLTHRDFVNVRFTGPRDPQPHYGDGSLLPASNSTRNLLKDFVSKHQFVGGTEAGLGSAVTDMFLAFSSAQAPSSLPRCHQTLIVITDTSLGSDLPSQFATQQSVLASPVDVFVFSLADPFDNFVAEEIACENRGELFSLADPAQLQTETVNYYKFYSAAIQSSDSVVWSDYFTDVLTGRSLISACLPVYDPVNVGDIPVLIGVTCVHIDPEYILTLQDGAEVLASIVSSDNVVCPVEDLTDAQRDSLRNLPCSGFTIEPPTPPTGGGNIDLLPATDFYLATLPAAVAQHGEAYNVIIEQIESATKPFPCPYLESLPLFDLCNLDSYPDVLQNFSPSEEFGGRLVSFDGIGVLFAPEISGHLKDGSITLGSLQSDQPLFDTICPALTEETHWVNNRKLFNFTSLQLLVSDSGVSFMYPAIAQESGVCELEDARLSHYYTSITSAYKDVVVVLDLESPPASIIGSPYFDAMLYIVFNTLAETDYFNVVAGGTNLFNEPMQRYAYSDVVDAFVMFLVDLKYVSDSQDGQLASGFAMITQLWDSRSQIGINPAPNCQPAIILLTDRELSEASVMQITTDNTKFTDGQGQSVKVFINSFGAVSSPLRELTATCENGGVWNVIPAEEHDQPLVIEQKVNSYSRVLAEVITQQAPLWTSAVVTNLPGITLCNPVYQGGKTGAGLIGSSCVVVTDDLFSRTTNGDQLRLQLLSNEHTQAYSTCATLQSPSAESLDQFRPEGLTCGDAPVTIEPTPSDSTDPSTSSSSSSSTTSSSSSTSTSSSSSDGSDSTTNGPGPSQTPAGTEPNEGTTDASTSSKNSGLNSGEIVAIVFGIAGVLFGVVGVTLGVFAYKKAKSSKNVRGGDDIDYEPAGQALQEHLLEDGEARESPT